MYTIASSMRARRPRKHVLVLFLLPAIGLLLFWHATRSSSWSTVPRIEGVRAGHGGTWHIPQSWVSHDSTGSPVGCNATDLDNIADAAECALHLALVNNAFMDNSQIPLIVHQKARSADPKTWSPAVHSCVEEWIAAATPSSAPSAIGMAWFMWDDDGAKAMVEKYEHNLYSAFSALPYPIEQADMFRVVALKWFGGIYADTDSKPLKHPSSWIGSSDTADWLDTENNKHTQHHPSQPVYVTPNDAPASYISRVGSMKATKNAAQKTVNAIFGLEADNLPDPDDTYWRMGYTFPVQVTNWAFAMSPHHPVASLFLSDIATRIQTDMDILPTIDPLNITGPPVLTQTLKSFTEHVEPNFSWQSLSNIPSHNQLGRSKIIAGDILILPITGFSPGRGWYQNMGSKPTSHPSARLQHLAAGSWRKPDLAVTYGKLCRTFFGRCREWSKIPLSHAQPQPSGG